MQSVRIYLQVLRCVCCLFFYSSRGEEKKKDLYHVMVIKLVRKKKWDAFSLDV